MILATHPDFYKRLIDSRFIGSTNEEQVLSPEFHLDLECAFNNPDYLNLKHFQKYPLTEVLTYLKKTHKLYLSRSLDKISEAIEKLTISDEKFSPLQTSLRAFFQDFRTHLEEHIAEEETHLFPYIESLLLADNKPGSPLIGKQKERVIHFLMHHNDGHEKDLQQLTEALQKSPFNEDSFAFKMLVNHLLIFELNLRIHAKMEEEVLMAQAIELEKRHYKRVVKHT